MVTFIFSGLTGPILAVRATGGNRRQVTQLRASHADGSHRFPQFLPDGRHFLFYALPSGMTMVGNLQSGEVREVLRTDARAVYASGHLLFNRQTIT